MIRALALAAVVVSSGCELIADIPNPTVVDAGDAMGSGSDVMPIECMDNTTCTMIGKPICDGTTHMCGGCVLDNQCPSNVCLMDGTCADAARFVYAAAGGSSDLCTSAMPCTIDTAVTKLTATKDIVKLAPGTYARTATLTMNIAGTIAGGGSTFMVAGAAGTVAIVAMGVPIRVIGLTISLANNNQGVRCLVAGGELHLARMTISGGNGSINTQCPVEIDRSTVTGSSLFSFYANGAPVTLRNSYFVSTATAGTYMIAAVHLESVPSGTIEHVTIANTTSAGPSGLRCPGSAAVVIRNIIAWNNVAPGIDPECIVTNSVVDPGYTGSTTNVSMDPLFMDVAGRNFHLMPSSPAARKGTPAAMFGIDGDGDDRPLPAGSDPDPGADEIP